MTNTTTIGWLKNHLTSDQIALIKSELANKIDALERRQPMPRWAVEKVAALDDIIAKLTSPS